MTGMLHGHDFLEVLLAINYSALTSRKTLTPASGIATVFLPGFLSHRCRSYICYIIPGGHTTQCQRHYVVETTSRRRFDVIMTLTFLRVSVGDIVTLYLTTQWKKTIFVIVVI